MTRTRLPGCAPGEGGLCWVPSPGRSCSGNAERKPGTRPARPRGPSAPSLLPCPRLQEAGWRERPAWWVGKDESAPASPASQTRSGAELSLRQTRLAAPPHSPLPRLRSWCSLPVSISWKCCSSRSLGSLSREAESYRRHRPPGTEPTPLGLGWGGRGVQPSLLGGETLRPEGL